MTTMEMYNVRMSRHTASEARRKLFHLLDSVEQGDTVILERKGVQFRLSLVQEPRLTEPQPSPIRVLDRSILDGDWSWEADANGELSFAPRKEKP